jgi:hypothetical protein
MNERLSAALLFARDRSWQRRYCGICGVGVWLGKRRLARDHDHKTGKFRGYLCTNCNLGLGNFKDDVRILRSAIDYLSETQTLAF